MTPTRELVSVEVNGWRGTGSIMQKKASEVIVDLEMIRFQATAPSDFSLGSRFIPPKNLKMARIRLELGTEPELRDVPGVSAAYLSQISYKRFFSARVEHVDLADIQAVHVEYLGLRFRLPAAPSDQGVPAED